MVESNGQKCYLVPTDLRDRANCQKVVDEALKNMGGIDILFNNAAFQMIKQDISELSEYVVAFGTPACGAVRDANRQTGSSGSRRLTPTSTPSSSSPSTRCRT